MPLLLAALSACSFGFAMVTGRVGLRLLDSRSAAAISVPTATMLFIIAAPFTIDWSAFSVLAFGWFAVVGLVYPAVVTLFTFRSNEELGPTVTSAISGTAPLFALPAAALFLNERVPPQAMLASAGVAVGVALLTWTPKARRLVHAGRALAWPVGGAVLRGFAQAGAKAGLLLWPNPFAASLIGYLVSCSMVVAVQRARGTRRRITTRPAVLWFMLTGILNGAAMLLMYAALSIAPVSTVAPIIAAYPLITVAATVAFLRSEAPAWRMICGAIITVAAIVYLALSRN